MTVTDLEKWDKRQRDSLENEMLAHQKSMEISERKEFDWLEKQMEKQKIKKS